MDYDNSPVFIITLLKKHTNAIEKEYMNWKDEGKMNSLV